MSYILDALRRAERERAQVQPVLEIVTQGGAPQIVQRRPAWPWMALAAVLLLAGAVALLWPKSQPQQVVVVAPAPRPAQLPPQEAPVIDDSEAALSSLDDLAQPGPKPLGEEGATTVIMPITSAPEDEAALADPEQGAPIEPFDAAQEPPPSAADYGLGPRPPPAPAPTRVESVQLDPAPEPDLPRYKDLPAAYRADFPKLTLDVHVYDKLATKRWAMINARRYREGEATIEGPRIAEIRESGIVFEYRGEKFLYPLGG